MADSFPANLPDSSHLVVGVRYMFGCSARPGTGSLDQSGFVAAMRQRGLEIEGGEGAISRSGDSFAFYVTCRTERTVLDARQMTQNAAYHVGVRVPAAWVHIRPLSGAEAQNGTFGGLIDWAGGRVSAAGRSAVESAENFVDTSPIAEAADSAANTVRFVAVALGIMAAVWFLAPFTRRA